MSITLKSTVTSSVSTPPADKGTIFINSSDGNVSIKKSTGNIFVLGGGQQIYSYFINEENAETTYKNVGSVYLQNGTLSVSSSAQIGTVNGIGSTTATLYKEDTGTTVTSWTVVSGQLQEVLLSNSASIPQDGWYSVKIKMNFGSDTALIKGIRLVFE